MITTPTQQMGTQPVAARSRGAVAGVFAFCSAHRPAAHPYACVPARGLNRNRVLVSGMWVPGSLVGITCTTKRPSRPLASRTT